MSALLFASSNQHKFIEISSALRHRFHPLLDLSAMALRQSSPIPEVIEDQDSFVGNALKKAKAYAAWSGELTLSDDSGLVVPALNGAPGIYSARYAGPQATDRENCEKLLEGLQNIPADQRDAYFVCVLVLYDPATNSHQIYEGRCEGRIAASYCGNGGFGYDPIFYIPALGKTMAELSLQEKNAISHRGRALALLMTEKPR